MVDSLLDSNSVEMCYRRAPLQGAEAIEIARSCSCIVWHQSCVVEFALGGLYADSALRLTLYLASTVQDSGSGNAGHFDRWGWAQTRPSSQ
jgi:hypothetical protein